MFSIQEYFSLLYIFLFFFKLAYEVMGLMAFVCVCVLA